MWPFGVIAIPELAEALLTLLNVTPSRALVQNLHLQTAMKTFLLALGLRVIRPSMNEFDPKAQQPDTELCVGAGCFSASPG
jgi:hypothetical protein